MTMTTAITHGRLTLAGGAAAWLTVAACALPSGIAHADAVEDFYKGRQMTMIISTGAGGGVDLMGRLIARHMVKYIPGQPHVVPKNMPGGGHMRATNFLYSQAPQDGSHLGAIIPSIVMHQMLGGEGVQYDAAKINWIGSSSASNSMLYVWHTKGVKSLEDAMKTEVIIGGTGVGAYTVLYPVLMNNVLGTKFKIVVGYKASDDVDLAMEKGEVDGRAGATFNTLMSGNADWVRDHKIDILVQIGTERDPGFKQVPLLTDFAKTQEQREVLQLFCDEIALGRPLLTTPNVPADRVAALRKAFDATMKDQAFLAEAQKARLDVMPTGGARIQQLVEGMIGTKDSVVARTKAALDTKGKIDEKGKGK
jgi:tripartite-type tricarboxylate transporter receptor subunit TctC